MENEADSDQIERGVMAAGIAKAGQLLAKKYSLQITNVPYLGKRKFDKILSDFVSENYSVSKSDLATVFIERLLKTSIKGGSICSVMPNNWLFLTSYKKYREDLLKTKSFGFVARLGEHAFENTEAAGAFACMFSLNNITPGSNHEFFGVNASNSRGEKPIYASEKAVLIKTNELILLNQKKQITNPDSSIVFEDISQISLLEEYADSYQGSGLGDITQFRLFYWELPLIQKEWVLHVSSPNGYMDFTGMHFTLRWADGTGAMANSPLATLRGRKAWGNMGVIVAWLGRIPAGRFFG